MHTAALRVRLALGTAAILTAASVGGCSELVAGDPVAASGDPQAPATTLSPTTTVAAPPSAESLLLPSGTATPAGVMTTIPVGPNYFTSAEPADCDAAILFKGSPLVPPGATSRAETAYQTEGTAMMAESADVYGQAIDPGGIVRDGFTAVSRCSGDAVGMAPQGPSDPMRLTMFSMAGDGVLVWTMSRPDWTCDYGLAAIDRAVLMLSLCDEQPGFPMADWAKTRRDQMLSQTS